MIDHNELLPPGKELGGFRIETQLGHGNMGIIYRAIQINLNRPVALKVLFQRVAADQDFVRSFFREAQAAAAFTHQNIVQAFDVGQSNDGIYYFAMELIEGGDIDDRLKNEGPYTAEAAIELMINIADGLDYGSSLRKLTHGDIKPANIMLTKGKKPKLADLGLARMGGEIQGESDDIMLTPLYAAPEMIQGQWVVGDPRADMYSVGATLYHMITGAPPFQDDDYRNVIHMQVNNQHIPLTEFDSSIPASISQLIDKLLAKSPDDRFPTWEDAKKAMTHALETAHVKESKKKKKVLHYHKSNDHLHSKKAKSKTSLLTFLVIILTIAGFFALTLTKDNSLTEYEKLQATMLNDSVDDKILKLEDFITRLGSKAPEEAKTELSNLLNSQPSGIFNTNLKEVSRRLAEFQTKLKANDPSFINRAKYNPQDLAQELDKSFTDQLNLHIPFQNTAQSFANFTPLANISIKGSPKYTEGKIKQAVKLEGDSFNYGDLPETRFSKSGSFTISFWLKPQKLTFPILGKCEVGDGQLKKGYLVSLNNGKVQLSLYGDKTDDIMNALSSNVIEVDKWSHVTVQYSNMTPKIFISGINQDLQLSSTLTKDFACSGPFVIGFKYFSGTIDEVRIWSHQLSAKNISEVSSLDSPTNLEKTINNFQKVLDKSKSSTAHTSSSTDLQNKNFQAAGFTLNKYLIELSQNTHKWQVYSEKTLTAIEQHKQDTELPLFRFVTTNLQGAKLELIETLKTRAHMRFLGKEALKDERFKDLKIRKLDKDFITFSTITPYGMVLNRYYLDEPASQAALEALVKQAIIYTPQIFKDSPQSLLAAMIISKGKAYSQLAKSISDQRYRKMLKRVSMELQP